MKIESHLTQLFINNQASFALQGSSELVWILTVGVSSTWIV